MDTGIDADGQVMSVCLVKGLRPDVDQAAIAAVQQWRYEPARWRSTGAAFPMVMRIMLGIYPKPIGQWPRLWHADTITRPNHELPMGAKPPALLMRVEPDVSAVARPVPRGIVILGLGIDETGGVKSPCVLRGVRDDADAATVAAVRHWRYEPVQNGGYTQAIVMTATVAISPEVARQ